MTKRAWVLPWLLLGSLGLSGCTKLTHQLADESVLRQRCVQLNVTCEIQWKSMGRTGGQWMASASSRRNEYSKDWWFAWGETRPEAIDKLNMELGGSPTNPADPQSEVLYKAKP